MTTPAAPEEVVVGASRSRQTPSKRRPETSDTDDVSSPAKRLQTMDTPPPPPTAKRLLFDEPAAPAHPTIEEPPVHEDDIEVRTYTGGMLDLVVFLPHYTLRGLIILISISSFSCSSCMGTRS